MAGEIFPRNKREVINAAENIGQRPLCIVEVKEDIHAGIRRNESLLPTSLLRPNRPARPPEATDIWPERFARCDFYVRIVRLKRRGGQRAVHLIELQREIASFPKTEKTLTLIQSIHLISAERFLSSLFVCHRHISCPSKNVRSFS